MYILTFKDKQQGSFGSVGVFTTLKQVSERIIDNQSNKYKGTIKALNFVLKSEDKLLKYDEVENHLKQNFYSYCACVVEGDFHTFDIREQDNICLIK